MLHLYLRTYLGFACEPAKANTMRPTRVLLMSSKSEYDSIPRPRWRMSLDTTCAIPRAAANSALQHQASIFRDRRYIERYTYCHEKLHTTVLKWPLEYQIPWTPCQKWGWSDTQTIRCDALHDDSNTSSRADCIHPCNDWWACENTYENMTKTMTSAKMCVPIPLMSSWPRTLRSTSHTKDQRKPTSADMLSS